MFSGPIRLPKFFKSESRDVCGVRQLRMFGIARILVGCGVEGFKVWFNAQPGRMIHLH